MRRNIELKARCRDLSRAAAAVLKLGARQQEVLIQTDTYFRVPQGRLKLRETKDQPAELIFYDRPDSTAFRDSHYDLVTIADPTQTKLLLSRALGPRGEVRKQRTLYLWHNIRIHLDDVAGLGSFLEFEAVISSPVDETPSQERLTTLTEVLMIRPEERVAASYSDLLGLGK